VVAWWVGVDARGTHTQRTGGTGGGKLRRRQRRPGRRTVKRTRAWLGSWHWQCHGMAWHGMAWRAARDVRGSRSIGRLEYIYYHRRRSVPCRARRPPPHPKKRKKISGRLQQIFFQKKRMQRWRIGLVQTAGDTHESSIHTFYPMHPSVVIGMDQLHVRCRDIYGLARIF
jgi:hypothetical protein